MAAFISFASIFFIVLSTACDQEISVERIRLENRYPPSAPSSEANAEEGSGIVWEVDHMLDSPRVTEVEEGEVVEEVPATECPMYGNAQSGYFSSWIDGDIDQPIHIDNVERVMMQRGVLAVLDDCGEGYIVRGIGIGLITATLPESIPRLTVWVGKKGVSTDCVVNPQDGGDPDRHYIRCGGKIGIDVAIRPGEATPFMFRIDGLPVLSRDMSDWVLNAVLFITMDIRTADENDFMSGVAPRRFVWQE